MKPPHVALAEALREANRLLASHEHDDGAGDLEALKRDILAAGGSYVARLIEQDRPLEADAARQVAKHARDALALRITNKQVTPGRRG